MKRVWVKVAVITIILVTISSICTADSMWDYQMVNSIGYGIHPKVWADESDPNSAITIEGVALAGFDEILDPNLQYTVFLQDENSNLGGMQAWTGKFLYGDMMWALLRTTDYIDFQAGDRLRITGLIADMGRGKVVINNRGHSGAPNLIWHVEILGHPGLPDPELIPSIYCCNYFDETRAGGGERYQTRYTMLHGVQISGGIWGNNNLMTITDDTGSVGMLLSAMGDFNSYSQPEEKLNVVGIFDQEDDTIPPYTDGYRIWIKKMSDIAVALDVCREARYRNENERVALINKVVSRVYDGYFYIQDEKRAGGIKVISSRPVNPGDIISIQGIVRVDEGEIAIFPNYLSISEQGNSPPPLFVNSNVFCGEYGLDVFGLLVRICGRVGTDQGDEVHSLVVGGKTIYVKTNGVTMPAEGTLVAITGIAAQYNGMPMLLLSNDNDIQTFTE